MTGFTLLLDMFIPFYLPPFPERNFEVKVWLC